MSRDPREPRSPGGAPPSRNPVPLQDPVREYRELKEEIDAAVQRVAESGRYVLGSEVEAFEEAVAERLGVAEAVGVGNGTDALILALRSTGVDAGDEVITTPFSFFATVEAILHVGARPVFADVRPDTLNLDPAAAAAAVTSRTAALLPVHLYGQMADMESLRRTADRHGLALVEDAAQAMGASQRIGGEPVPAGAAGDVGCFSFYPTKNLGGWGDGGMVVTDDPELGARIRRLRDHGLGPEDRFRHREVGLNSRLDTVQAAVLRVKLGALDGWNERRRSHAREYSRVVGELPDLRPPHEATGNRHVFHQYTIRCGRRDAVVRTLRREDIGHGIYYPVPLHRQEALREALSGPAGVSGRFAGGDGGVREADPASSLGRFPEAERAAEEVLSLPVFPGLEEGERGRVREALRRAVTG